MSIRRVYETTIIINAALEDPDIDVVISKVTTLIQNHGGVIEEQNKWGRRRLAYAINKKYNGYYVHLIFEVAPNIVPVLERFLVLEDTILRHLTLQLSAELRAFRKEKSLAAGNLGATTMSSIAEIERDFNSEKIIYKSDANANFVTVVDEEIIIEKEVSQILENDDEDAIETVIETDE